jgi:hypothetical protein
MNKEKLEALAAQLAALAAIIVPGHAVAIGGVLQVATQLNNMLKAIQKDDPETWKLVRGTWRSAVKDWQEK